MTIRTIRKSRHLTQAALAKRAGVHQGAVSDLELGADPKLSTAVAVAGALGLSLEAFVDALPIPPPSLYRRRGRARSS